MRRTPPPSLATNLSQTIPPGVPPPIVTYPRPIGGGSPLPSTPLPPTTAQCDDNDFHPSLACQPCENAGDNFEFDVEDLFGSDDPHPTPPRPAHPTCPDGPNWRALTCVFGIVRWIFNFMIVFQPHVALLRGFRNPDSNESDEVTPECHTDGEILVSTADLDLGAVDMDKQDPIPMQKGMKEGKPWTVDSGAAESVADPDDIPEGILEPSAASKAGRGYVGAGKERIPNVGQVRARRVTETGRRCNNLFQGAKGQKAIVGCLKFL